MPDITMCTGENCPKQIKEKCYRFMATPSRRQSFFVTSPMTLVEGRKVMECKYFSEIEK